MEESGPPFYRDLEQDIREQEMYIERGERTIEEWYSLPEDQREEKSRIDRPPHIFLKERGEAFIEKAVTDQIINEDTFEFTSQTHIHDILFAVGTESLIKSILLKYDPEYYIENNLGNDLTLKPAINQLMSKLPDDLPDDQRKRICLSLKAVKVKRDNVLHFGYRRHMVTQQYIEIYRVIAYLLFQFYPDSNEILEMVVDRVKELEEIAHSQYEPVDLLDNT